MQKQGEPGGTSLDVKKQAQTTNCSNYPTETKEREQDAYQLLEEGNGITDENKKTQNENTSSNLQRNVVELTGNNTLSEVLPLPTESEKKNTKLAQEIMGAWNRQFTKLIAGIKFDERSHKRIKMKPKLPPRMLKRKK